MTPWGVAVLPTVAATAIEAIDVLSVIEDESVPESVRDACRVLQASFPGLEVVVMRPECYGMWADLYEPAGASSRAEAGSAGQSVAQCPGQMTFAAS